MKRKPPVRTRFSRRIERLKRGLQSAGIIGAFAAGGSGMGRVAVINSSKASPKPAPMRMIKASSIPSTKKRNAKALEWRLHMNTPYFKNLLKENNQCPEIKIPGDIILRMIFAESSGNPKAIEYRKDKSGNPVPIGFGLLQVRPETVEELKRVGRVPKNSEPDLLNPQDNISVGTTYLNYLWDTVAPFGSRKIFEDATPEQKMRYVRAAWNTGPTTVRKKGITERGKAYNAKIEGME